jgi:hypothetical protein
MPFAGVRMFLESMRGVSRTGHDYLTKINNPPSPKVDRASAESSQSFTLDANIIIAGYSGREACMDLYHSSAQARMAVKRGSNEYRAEPVVRVTLTTKLLMEIHDELAAIATTMPQDDTEEIEVEAEHE